jgi:hypothetical protein
MPDAHGIKESKRMAFSDRSRGIVAFVVDARPVLCEKWMVQNRCDIERFSSVRPERSSANPCFLALLCLPESQL